MAPHHENDGDQRAPAELLNAPLGMRLAGMNPRSVAKRPLWKEALAPTLLLGGLWLVFSLATTAYIARLDRGYQRVVDEDVSSMRAAGEIQAILWSLHDTLADASERAPSPETAQRIDGETRRLRAALQSAESVANRDDERRVVSELKLTFEEHYLQLVLSFIDGTWSDSREFSKTRDESRELAVKMSSLCSHLREISQGLINAETEQRKQWNFWIGGSRMVLLFLGPILGVWMGVRAASRVRRRLAEIRIRLEGASDDLGCLEVSSTTSEMDFDEVDRQVLAITKRLQDVVQQLRSARHEVLRSERLAAVGQLAAGVAHELRNPLTAVKLLVQTVAREHRDNHDTAKQLGVVQDEVVRMERTIQSLLDFARPPAQNRMRHDLRETIGRALNLMEGSATRDHVQIQVTLPNVPFEVDGDPEQLHQVFVNLLLNGIDAISERGKISVSLQRAPSKSVSPKTTHPECAVIVADNGSGIPESVIERLFEPFVTTKDRGTGLGLAVSRSIIEEHQGTLTAANGFDGGAVFTVRLPLIVQPDQVETTARPVGVIRK